MPNGFPERFLGLPVIGIQFMPEIRANNCILDILPWGLQTSAPQRTFFGTNVQNTDWNKSTETMQN